MTTTEMNTTTLNEIVSAYKDEIVSEEVLDLMGDIDLIKVENRGNQYDRVYETPDGAIKVEFIIYGALRSIIVSSPMVKNHALILIDHYDQDGDRDDSGKLNQIIESSYTDQRTIDIAYFNRQWKAFDKYYAYSDDHRVWSRGRSESARLSKLRSELIAKHGDEIRSELDTE